LGYLDRGLASARKIEERLIGGIEPPHVGSTVPERRDRPGTARDQIESLRGGLPPPVTTGTGQKTHGRWIGPDGAVHTEVSSKDAKHEQAIQFFREIKARRIPLRASDVEMKLAVHMRINDIRSVTLAVNHVPCEGPMGCDALVPVILPEGTRSPCTVRTGSFASTEEARPHRGCPGRLLPP
jgi:hypothetical protein